MRQSLICAAIAGAVLLTLPPTGGLAAVAGTSFDCGKAKTHVELAICGDSELAALDAQVGVDYHRRLALTPKDQRPAAIAGQRAWIADRQRQCGGYASIETGLGQCLLGALRSRAAALEDEVGDLENANAVAGALQASDDPLADL